MCAVFVRVFCIFELKRGGKRINNSSLNLRIYEFTNVPLSLFLFFSLSLRSFIEYVALGFVNVACVFFWYFACVLKWFFTFCLDPLHTITYSSLARHQFSARSTVLHNLHLFCPVWSYFRKGVSWKANDLRVGHTLRPQSNAVNSCYFDCTMSHREWEEQGMLFVVRANFLIYVYGKSPLKWNNVHKSNTSMKHGRENPSSVRFVPNFTCVVFDKRFHSVIDIL